MRAGLWFSSSKKPFIQLVFIAQTRRVRLSVCFFGGNEMLLLKLSQTNVITSNQVPSCMLLEALAEASLITLHTTILQLRAPQIWVGSFLQSDCLLKVILGFPGSSVVKETWVRSPTQGDPKAAEQLSPCTTTTEPVLYSLGVVTAEAHAPWSPCSTSKRSPCSEKPVNCNWRVAPARHS